jgi:hypothetical protein
MFYVATVVHGVLFGEELFGNAIGLDPIHMKGTLLLVEGVEAQAGFLVNIGA